MNKEKETQQTTDARDGIDALMISEGHSLAHEESSQQIGDASTYEGRHYDSMTAGREIRLYLKGGP
jgi:hypothetical protein